MSKVTHRQRELARNALGLPNEMSKSYRNIYVAGRGASRSDWEAMVKSGLAVCDPPTPRGFVWFYLTRAGAELALNRGESLCSEDFQAEEQS